MRTSNAFLLSVLIASGLAACGKNSSPAGVAEGQKKDKTEVVPPLGSALCKDPQSACRKFQIKMRQQEVNGFLSPGGEAYRILNEALPKVLSAKSNEGLEISINLPEASQNEEIEIEIPKLDNESEMSLGFVSKSLIAAFNNSDATDLYVYARKSETASARPRIKVTFHKIDEADRKSIANVQEFAPAAARPEEAFGDSDFRGAQQEFTIAPTAVPFGFLNDQVISSIKEGIFPIVFQALFQDGHLKSEREDHPQRVDKSRDYCYLTVRIEKKPQPDSLDVGGTITLVSGDHHYGPITVGKGPGPDFSQGSSMGLKGMGAESYNVPGKGYNKTGNGRHDSPELYRLGCESRKAEQMTIKTALTAFGENRVTVVYPRMNTLEAALDIAKGLKPAAPKSGSR